MNDKILTEIAKICASYYNMSIDTMFSKSRKREIVQARQIAMYLAHKNTKFTLAFIGKIGNKDHTTVLHAITTIDNLRQTYKQIDREYKEIFELCKRSNLFALAEEKEQFFIKHLEHLWKN